VEMSDEYHGWQVDTCVRSRAHIQIVALSVNQTMWKDKLSPTPTPHMFGLRSGRAHTYTHEAARIHAQIHTPGSPPADDNSDVEGGDDGLKK